jgi:hypothetical protein
MKLEICLLLLSAVGVCQNLKPTTPSRLTQVKADGVGRELRTLLVTDFPIGMGYSHPRMGGGIAGDIFIKRFWFSGESRLLWAGKIDGGPGFTYTNEGTANLGTKKNFYIGGGALWTVTRVRDYSKSAYHPVIQAASRLHFGKSSRISLVVVRFTGEGSDRRNHYREIGGSIRVPMAQRFNFEPYCGVSHFHATDNPGDKRVGFEARLTLSFQLKGRIE